MLVSWYAAPPSKWRLLHDLLATDSIRFPWSLCLSRGPLTFPSVRHCRFGVLWVMWTCDNASASSVTMKAWPFTWDALGQWILWIRWHLERFYPQGGCGGSSLGSNFLVIDAIKDERWHFAYCTSLVFWCFGFFCWGGGFSRNASWESTFLLRESGWHPVFRPNSSWLVLHVLTHVRVLSRRFASSSWVALSPGLVFYTLLVFTTWMFPKIMVPPNHPF